MVPTRKILPLSAVLRPALGEATDLFSTTCITTVGEATQFSFTPMAVNPISLGSPHVRPMGVHCTCGEPDEIKKNTHPKNIAALVREQVEEATQFSLSLKRNTTLEKVRVPGRSIPPPWRSITQIVGSHYQGPRPEPFVTVACSIHVLPFCLIASNLCSLYRLVQYMTVGVAATCGGCGRRWRPAQHAAACQCCRHYKLYRTGGGGLRILTRAPA